MTYSFYRQDFDPEEVEIVKRRTNPYGRNYNYEGSLPQDELLYAKVTVGKTTGFAFEYHWKSGRSDVDIIVDLPEEQVSKKAIIERKKLISNLRRAHEQDKRNTRIVKIAA